MLSSCTNIAIKPTGEPESMQLVTSEYNKLQKSIGDLGTMISGSLERQREEIQRSQKTQMRKVQVDVDTLRLEKARLEESIATNERACLLENERDWYKKEALHLDKVLEQTNSRQKELVERLDESEHDREWLKQQVKKETKQKLMLEKKLKELGVDTNALIVDDSAEVKDSDVSLEKKIDEKAAAEDGTINTSEGTDFVTEAAQNEVNIEE